MPVPISAVRNKKLRDTPAFLLQDDFTDTRAAGSVNGTASTPGPGTRIVTDTENKITVGSGNIVFASGKVAPAWGDPGYWLGAVTRTAGRFLVASVSHAALASQLFRIGWDSLQSGTPDHEAISFTFAPTTGSFGIMDGGVAYTIGDKFAATTKYYIAVVMRASGAYPFIKGGTYTNWILLFPGSGGNTVTVYPAMSLYTNSAATVGFIRVPAETWLPQPSAYDTFTRAAIGSTEALGPDGQDTPVLAWSQTIGTWGISGNAANCSALVGGVGLATIPATSANVIADVAVTRAAGAAGALLRYQDADNYLYAYQDGTNACLVKRVAAVESNVIGPTAAAYGAGRVLRVVLDGTAAELYYNGVRIGTGGTVPASTYAVHGLWSNNTNPTLDNFTIFPRGTGNEYSKLDDYIQE